MSKQPPPAPTVSAVGHCPTIIQIVGRPGTGSLPSTIAPPDHPCLPKRGRKRRERIDESKNVQTNPTRTYCKCSRPLPYCNPNCRTPPALEVYPAPSHHPTTPEKKEKEEKDRTDREKKGKRREREKRERSDQKKESKQNPFLLPFET